MNRSFYAGDWVRFVNDPRSSEKIIRGALYYVVSVQYGLVELADNPNEDPIGIFASSRFVEAHELIESRDAITELFNNIQDGFIPENTRLGWKWLPGEKE
ncbi:MAG TPA: hypothetical protein VGL77_02065 [Armatimonadota bacterium]|jgi:hypothetical protein